jgi:hypothetical protein
MKEVFDVMAEHWCVTLWLGIVVMVSLHRTSITNKEITNKYYGKNEESKPGP